MESPQSVVSPFKSSVIGEPEKQKAGFLVRSSLSKGTEVTSKETAGTDPESMIGVLEVYIHQARDIHNICIYHKQDVYAKICLTSDPEKTVSTKIINGGGRNPVFNENLRLNVRTVEASLKCEIFMMSRVKNYLEDQLLGFALVPLSEVLVKNGKLEKEFSLSSTDLFHSPAGFVQLSLSYNGASPEVMAIPAPPALAADAAGQNPEPAADFDKIEFPDPKIEKENESMVSEYFSIPPTELDTRSSDSLISSDANNDRSSKMGACALETLSSGTEDSVQHEKVDSPPSSVSTNGVDSSAPAPASSETSDAKTTSKLSPKQDKVEASKEKSDNAGVGESDSSSGEAPAKTSPKPVVNLNFEPEQKVVQEEIVDMYMKSMQQFTESLAKMKLPLDVESGPTDSGNSSTDKKLQASKNSGGRVFYGSRAFF